MELFPWLCLTTSGHQSNLPLSCLALPSPSSSPSLTNCHTTHSCHSKTSLPHHSHETTITTVTSCSDLTTANLLSVDVEAIFYLSSPPPILPPSSLLHTRIPSALTRACPMHDTQIVVALNTAKQLLFMSSSSLTSNPSIALTLPSHRPAPMP